MPPKRKLYKIETQPTSSIEKKPVSPYADKEMPKRIATCPTKSALIPFAVRAVQDFDNHKRLTPTQIKIVEFLKSKNLDRQLLLRYQRMPETIRKAFDQKYFTLKTSAEVEKHFVNTLAEAGKMVVKQLEKAAASKEDTVINLGFTRLGVPYHTWMMTKEFADRQKEWRESEEARKKAEKEAEEFAKREYLFERRYHGITTLKTGDRSSDNKVEPYIVQGTYRVPMEGGFEELIPPFPILQKPWSLGPMPPDQWKPSGGDQDELGYPSKPITMLDLNFPPYDRRLLYYNVIGVWEQDGGQSAEVAKQMGIALAAVGGAVLAAGTAIPCLPAIIAGAVIVAVGAVLEFVSALWSSSEADDHIGDLLYTFSQSEIERQSSWEDALRVTSSDGSNDWILYFGNSSWLLSG